MTGSFDGRPYFTEGIGPGQYKTPVMLRKQDGEELILGQYWDFEEKEWTNWEEGEHGSEHAVSCVPVDWDGDGDFDLIQGTTSGLLFLRRNVGTAKEAVFANDGEPLMRGNKPVKTAAKYAMPIIADWDIDGRWDILAGSDKGAVEWFRNTGTDEQPSFDAGLTLIPALKGDASKRSGTDAQIAVADVNADGRLDILVGDHSMKTGGSGLSEEQEARRSEIFDILTQNSELLELANAKEDSKSLSEEQQEKVDEIQALMEELGQLQPKYQFSGWVWLYERAPASPR